MQIGDGKMVITPWKFKRENAPEFLFHEKSIKDNPSF